jgi:signal transduction histidine kinase
MRLWRLLERFDERGLRVLFAAFFLALAVPAGVLVAQAYGQLKWEAFRGTQLAAEELAARIDAALRAAIAVEDARSFGDWSFLVVEGDAAANFVQRSPLSVFPVTSAVPGVLGYFQVDAAGKLTTPLLPEPGVTAASYGIAPDEHAARAARVAELREVLAQNRLVRATRDDAPVPVEPQREQAAFDRLAAGVAPPPARAARAPASVAPAERDARAEVAAVRNAAEDVAAREAVGDERQKRVEQALVPQASLEARSLESVVTEAPKLELSVRTFESEVDPFEVGVLDTGHLVLFRNVWRDGQRYIQGALVDRGAFVAAVIEAPYRASSVAGVAGLGVTLQGRALDTLAGPTAPYASAPAELAGTLLHRARLSPPFGDLELAFVVTALPRAPGAALLAWMAVTLAVVLCGGFALMYRFAAGQMRLARQQQDFVSAVSHELKTPLTSIRMYGEMLKAGWADDAKKLVYYDYIHSESERLSRLIENVLQLARLKRNTQRFELKPAAVAELLDMVRSKVGTQVERAGFELTLRNDTPAGTEVVVDADAFAQIFINLVDNALKFAAAAERKVVVIAARREGDGGVLFTVRDFGPGVPKGQMTKIFELFYRAENELTRETVGTGIGLALVQQLAAAMRATVDIRNCEPGAEFRLRFAR